MNIYTEWTALCKDQMCMQPNLCLYVCGCATNISLCFRANRRIIAVAGGKDIYFVAGKHCLAYQPLHKYKRVSSDLRSVCVQVKPTHVGRIYVLFSMNTGCTCKCWIRAHENQVDDMARLVFVFQLHVDFFVFTL